MNTPVLPVRPVDREDHLINLRLGCARLGVLGSEPQPDYAEIRRTAEGLLRLLSMPITDRSGASGP